MSKGDKNIPELERKVYIIKKKKYYMPEDVDYIQWKNIKKILAKAEIKLSDFSTKEKQVDLGTTGSNIMQKLFDKDLIPLFFATVLIPEGEEYWEETMLSNVDDMMRISDIIMGEVLVRFLHGRENLVTTLIGFLTKFLSNIPTLEQKSDV